MKVLQYIRNDQEVKGGICDGLVVKGGKRLYYALCVFWIAASRGFLVDDEALDVTPILGVLHLTVPAPAQYSSVFESDETEPFEEGETVATPPPFGYPRDATRNGDDSHTSGTRTRRPVQAARECSYSEFLKCKPLDFKGTEGVVELTRWFEKMESVFSISNCTVSNQVKFATCTLQDDALTWWNSYVKTTT
nr:reverse transcriptase domain-containing protein [Tanacetum cinerariifolium]